MLDKLLTIVRPHLEKLWLEIRSTFKENARVVVEALLIALVIRSLFFQPFNIPSGSMKSGLLIGDFLISSKFSYGYSKYSFPFAPDLFKGRIFGSDPQRGDVAIFRPPNALNDDYIKRVIGLPGDIIQVKQGILHINEKAVTLTRLENFYDSDTGQSNLQFTETLPNGVTYKVLDTYDRRYNGHDTHETAPFKVPAGQYFMMGDNRGNSADSRVFGGVPLENFVAKAQIIFFSYDEVTLNKNSFLPQVPFITTLANVVLNPLSIRYSRVFNPIK